MSSDMYTVLSADNAHAYDNAEGVDAAGKFAPADEAILAAKAIIDRSLTWERTGGRGTTTTSMTASELFDQWQHFGDCPVIRSPSGVQTILFSASAYAKEKAGEMCEKD